MNVRFCVPMIQSRPTAFGQALLFRAHCGHSGAAVDFSEADIAPRAGWKTKWRVLVDKLSKQPPPAWSVGARTTCA